MFELSTDIKVTDVTDAFVNKVREVLQERASLAYPGTYEDKMLRRCITDRGIDRMITSLKKLNYVKFSCIKSPDSQIFLCGETDDLIFDNVRGNYYNVGPYFVCISVQSILDKQLEHIHLFPKRKPLARARHLHHGVYTPSRYEDIVHPLLCDEGTCWANIGPSYRSAVGEGDIVDMFRILYIYLIRLDWSSPLFSDWVSEVVLPYGERL